MKAKEAIEKFIDTHFAEVKQKLLVYGKVEPEVHLFFRYENCSDKEFGNIRLPYASEYFKSQQAKAFLPQYVQMSYDGIVKQFLPEWNKMSKIRVRLMAVVAMSDMSFKPVRYDRVTDPDQLPEGESYPSQDPASKEMIGYYVNEPNNVWCKLFPYTRRTGQIAFELKKEDSGKVVGGMLTKLFPKIK